MTQETLREGHGLPHVGHVFVDRTLTLKTVFFVILLLVLVGVVLTTYPRKKKAVDRP